MLAKYNIQKENGPILFDQRYYLLLVPPTPSVAYQVDGISNLPCTRFFFDRGIKKLKV
jgi:hypothetical protein